MVQFQGNVALAHIISSHGRMHLVMCGVSQDVLYAQTPLNTLQ